MPDTLWWNVSHALTPPPGAAATRETREMQSLADATLTKPAAQAMPSTWSDAARRTALYQADAAAEGRYAPQVQGVLDALHGLPLGTSEADWIVVFTGVVEAVKVDPSAREAVGEDGVTHIEDVVLRMHRQMLDGDAQAAYDAQDCRRCDGTGEGAYGESACGACRGRGFFGRAP